MKINSLRGAVSAATLLSLLLSGCDNRPAATTTAPAGPDAAPDAATVPSAVPAQAVCYRQVLGRDTTLVRLLISGAAVTGELAVLPAEKDRARGSLTGTLTGQQIVADWQRAGEGVVQVHKVRFTLAGDSLSWREGARTERAGKWVLTNPDQGYRYVLGKVACNQ